MDADKFVCVVLAVVMFISGFAVGNYSSRMALSKCEEPLPRNQHCTLTATQPDQPAEEER